MPETKEPLPKTYSVLEMLKILMEIIEWKMDPNTEWEMGDECTTVGNILDRAQIVIEKEEGR